MKHATTSASWKGLLLVCKDCPKRSNGPNKVKAKDAVSAARQAAKEQRQGVRVVRCSCLGMCPKGELVMASSIGSESRVAVVRRLAQIEGAVEALLAGS